MRGKIRRISAYTPLCESGRGASIRSEDSARGRVFRGVTMLRAGLGNQRDRNFYPDEVIKAAVEAGQFDGLRAFADHPDSVSEEILPERTIRDFVGLYENARWDPREKSAKADLTVFRSQKWLSDTIDELLSMGQADKIGLSINGRGETVPDRMALQESGEEVDVNRLLRFMELKSTDVVTEAGAGGGFPALLESARRAKEATMDREQIIAALREAVRAKDFEKAKELEDDLAELDGQEDTSKGSKAAKAKEACGGKKRKAAEAGTKRRKTEDAADDAGEGEDGGPDPDKELEEATDLAKDGTDPDEGEGEDGDEDGDEDGLEESCDEGSDEDGSDGDEDGSDGDEDGADERPPLVRAADRQRRFAAREAAIKGATGSPTGTVKSGSGSFVKPAKTKKKASKVPMALKKMRGTRESDPGGESDLTELRETNARLRLKNRRLVEALRVRASADRARKLLRESDLPKEVRPHLIDQLIGKSDEEMTRIIAFQHRIIEAAATRAKEDLLGDDFDAVEGAGSRLRESFGGSRGDDLSEVMAEVGLPMKQ